MRYALIGCGRIAINHIQAALDNKLEIVAICDKVVDQMQLLLDKCKVEDLDIKRYTDYKDLIRENEIDLISIATESGNHAEIALYCIEKKINIIIEKPIALSISDADKIIDLAEKMNVKISACHQNRFNLAVLELKRAIDEGRFGKISHCSVHIRWNRTKNYYDQAKWRGTWENDGGALMNQCIHGIDLLRWLLGDKIDEVYGVTKNQFHKFLEVEDIGMAVVKFSNGVVGTIEGTTNVYPRNLEETLYIFGENGTVKLGGKSTNAIEIWEFKDEKPDDIERKNLNEKTKNVYGNGHSRLFADMIGAIAYDRKPLVDAQAGKNALELVLSVYKSQKENRTIKLPVENFSTLDMLGEFNE